MSARITVEATEITAWRGYRGSGDMMNGTAALVLTAKNSEYPHTIVEIAGTPDELRALKVVLIKALEKETW